MKLTNKRQVDEIYILQFYFGCFFFYKKMDFPPPEIICMAKSYLTNRDLYSMELTCQYLFWCSVSKKEKRLRKCKLWKKTKEQFLDEIKNAANYCSHVVCWKYRCHYLSIEDIKYNGIIRVLRWAAGNGHLPVVQYLCEKFQLTIQDVRSDDNRALRWAADNGHLPVVKYLCKQFQLTIQDVRSWNNDALGGAAENGHLPVVQYLCETYSLTIEDVRSCNNEPLRKAAENGHFPVVQYLCEYRDRENRQLKIQDVRSFHNYALREAASEGHLPIVQYLCETFSLTIQDVRSSFALLNASRNSQLPVVQYLRQKYKIVE
jgi:hypothetical protein